MGTDIIVKWERRQQSWSDITLGQLEECATKKKETTRILFRRWQTGTSWQEAVAPSRLRWCYGKFRCFVLDNVAL